jgi:membrane protein DedA with SNARE-associated domain
VAQGRLFFRRWGVFSIFLGRFLGPLRAIVPLLAGVMRMHHPRFQLVNILSAIVWVPAMLAPGWVLAMSVDEIGAVGEGRWLTITMLPGLIAAALLILGVRLWRRRPRRLRVRPAPPAAAAPHHTPV